MRSESLGDVSLTATDGPTGADHCAMVCRPVGWSDAVSETPPWTLVYPCQVQVNGTSSHPFGWGRDACVSIPASGAGEGSPLDVGAVVCMVILGSTETSLKIARVVNSRHNQTTALGLTI